MKNNKITFWLLNIIGALAIFAALFSYSEGAEFNQYFWGGFCGLVLIGSVWAQEKNGDTSKP